MKKKYQLGDKTLVIASGNIEYDESLANIYKVNEDNEYTFDAITCAARPVEFSIVNHLSKLDKDEVIEACNHCNETKNIGVLSVGNYYLMLSPFVERYTFFGEEQSMELTNAVLDECDELNLKSLRITQFCMMRGAMPFYDQFKGILKAISARPNATVNVVYFDVPEKNFDRLDVLFTSYVDHVNKERSKTQNNVA